MPEDALQHDNIAAGHHEMTGERMPQNVRHLSFWQLNTGQPDHPIELFIAGREGHTFTGDQFVIQRAGEGNGTILFTFGIDEGEFVGRNLRAFDFGRLVPPCAGRKADFNDKR